MKPLDDCSPSARKPRKRWSTSAHPERLRGIADGKALLKRVARGADAEPPPEIEAVRARRKREPSPSAVDLLKNPASPLRGGRRRCAAAHRGRPRISRGAAHEDDGVPALHGWRAEVFRQQRDCAARRGSSPSRSNGAKRSRQTDCVMPDDEVAREAYSIGSGDPVAGADSSLSMGSSSGAS